MSWDPDKVLGVEKIIDENGREFLSKKAKKSGFAFSLKLSVSE